MGLIHTLKRTLRRATMHLSVQVLPLAGRYGGISGTKKTMRIRGKTFIIKPEQDTSERERRQTLIAQLQKINSNKENIFLLKVSKRHAGVAGMRRIEPHYDLPTLRDIRESQGTYTPQLLQKSHLTLPQLQQKTEAALVALQKHVKILDRHEHPIYSHERDILIDYEKGKVVFRIVDF